MEKIKEEIEKNSFVLLLLNEEEYMEKLCAIVKEIEKKRKKICYVCISKPYKDIKNDLKQKKINTDSIFFIDLLSAHYGTKNNKKDCIFLTSPNDIDDLRNEIRIAFEKKNCKVLVLDTVSAMLMYQESVSLLRFTNSFNIEKNEKFKKVFIALKTDYGQQKNSINLINDLALFADKTIDLSKNK